MSDSVTLEDKVIAALRRISRAIDLHSRLLWQKHGLTAPQLATLRAIERLQPVTLGGVARAVHLSQATVTGIVSRLEKRALVARIRDARDRRTVRVELTPEGATLTESAPSLLQERFREELAKIEEWEQTMILATLQRIASMMDAERIEAVPVLVSGVPGAAEEDVSRYFEKAVVVNENAPLAEELSGSSGEPPSHAGASADQPPSAHVE